MDIDSINFLPPAYQRRRIERERRLRLVGLLVLLCLGLVGWSLSQRSHTAQLREEAAMVDQQVAAARQQMEQVDMLRRRQTELSEQLALWSRLSQTVSHGRVFATLAGALPDAVVLTQLDVQSHRETSSPVAGQRARRNTRDSHSDATASRDRLVVDFTGLAPDDMTLANLLNRLKRHPLFDEVKLHFSRSVQVHGATGRQFRIELIVPLDRDYHIQPAQEEGVAHAR